MTKDFRERVVKEILYADDLVLLGESWEEVESRYCRWKKALKNKGMKVNINKTKALYTGGKIVRTQSCKHPCSICGRGVGRNSIQCTKCGNWVHKKCSGVLGSLLKVQHFECRKCLCTVIENLDKRISLDGDDIEIVDRFPYLGDVVSTEGGVQEAVTSRIRSAWRKFKIVSGLLCKKGLSLRVKGILYKIYVRTTLSYGAECWAMRMEDERKLKATEMRMLRMMCGKTLNDRISNVKIREMTAVEKIEEFIRGQRLRWLGHVERMDIERGPVKAQHLKIDGSKKGRPKKRRKEVLERDMTIRGLKRSDAQDRKKWKLGCSNRLTPACGETLPGSRRKLSHPP